MDFLYVHVQFSPEYYIYVVNIRLTQIHLDISRVDKFFLPTNGNRQMHKVQIF